MVDPTKIPQSEPRRSQWKLWVAGIAALLLIIFALQNSQKVSVDFIFATTQTPLIVALVIAGGLGALVGFLAPIVRRGHSGDRNREPDQKG